MKRLTILSIVTASFLMTACGNETKHSDNDIRIIKPQKEATETKANVAIDIKKTSIGEDKSIGDIIKTVASANTKTKEVAPAKVVAETTSNATSSDELAEMKASIKSELMKEFKSEFITALESEMKKANMSDQLKNEIKAELMVEFKDEFVKALKKNLDKKRIKTEATKVVKVQKEIKVPKAVKAPEAVKAVKAPQLVKASTTAFDYKLKPKKVADNVWCFFGAIEKPTKENAGNMANNCYIRTNEGYLVMDTGPSYQFAKQAYEAMSKIESLPVVYVVNSHEHDDHWLGNDFYKKKFNATLVGPESINTDYKEGDKTRMYNVLPANAIKGTHIIKLDKTPKKPYTISLGGEEFQIIPMPIKAHTRDDIFIYMPKRKVVFAGDLVMNGRITSGRDGSVMGQLKALDMLKKLDWKVLVPGHGFITDGTAMNEAEQYFTLTKERILKALEDDIDATEITEKVTLPEFKDKAMYDILNAQNIGFAFDELEMLDDE